MLPLKLIRSLTNDRRAQSIGSAISVTNESAAYNYLIGTAHRLYIEKKAAEGIQTRYTGEPWVDKSYNDYFKAANRRNTKRKGTYKFLVV